MKLKQLISDISQNVPYYKKLTKNKILKNSITITLEDIDEIPILTKDNNILSNQSSFINKKFNLNSFFIHKGRTGGTTGQPLKLFKDLNDRNWIWASYYRWYDWMSVSLNDKKMVIWGQPIIKNRFDFIIQYLNYLKR